MIDTHAHIYDLQFEDKDAMLMAAQDQNVSQIWMPNCARETIDAMMALAERYPDRCLPMMGLHPCYVTETVEEELAAVESWLNRYPFFAIGEIGLDFYWDLTHIDRQFEAFTVQLQWASQRNLPISIHSRSAKDGSRNAFAEAADLIEKLALPNLTGIFHCFVGTVDEARRAIDLGFKLGIGGVSTFKNGGLDTVIPHIDLEHLVLETDAPYLAPVPYRGKRNEPAYLKLIAQRVADLKQLPLEQVAEQTTRTSRQLLDR
ncbi:TatD DNase family protein [Larkinella arboricola]|uniref:TatD DNase family protein n=1 Tax=Larkinella arboricola TaxID=643671 RepID=A0A327X3S1_LARAB|nr:TatD family hydrolase [Larkinella arboricola]RAK00235.1 TatD DNase family protein [Larkinella arboricola]